MGKTPHPTSPPRLNSLPPCRTAASARTRLNLYGPGSPPSVPSRLIILRSVEPYHSLPGTLQEQEKATVNGHRTTRLAEEGQCDAALYHIARLTTPDLPSRRLQSSTKRVRR